ncbi:MAG: aminoacetone oxidase family FAD-binding enzyme, partial [bacterium]
MAISHWPVIVVGAGAAGLAAALFAARRGARVLLLETRPTPGAKLRVSGGGRCNVLPSEMRLERFHTDGSRPAMRNVLTSWPLEAVRGWFEEDLGVPLKVEATGKVFPTSDRSRDVVEALLAACAQSGVVLEGGHRVVQVECASQPENARFELRCANGRQLTCRHLVLTTGGLSLPKTGSDGGGLEIARVLGHTIVPTYPALVPLLTDEARWKALAGVSMRVRLRALEGTRCLEEREGDFLFTHRGFSGPATLDMSRHVCGPDRGGKRLVVEWAPQADWEKLLQSPGRRSVAGLLREHLPARVAGVLVELAGI